MTKLIKASTARKRAESVDTFEKFFGLVTGVIDYRSKNGYFDAGLSVPVEHLDKTLAALNKAGYATEEIVFAPCKPQPAPKGVVARFLNTFKSSTIWEDDLRLTPECDSEYDYVEVRISWTAEEKETI